MLPDISPGSDLQKHDSRCEAEYIAGAHSFTDCLCPERRAQKARDRDFQNMRPARTHQLRQPPQTF